jgi:hypothetical protein
MNLRIKRRRFGQLAIASAATTAIANFATKVVAQQPPLMIYGVHMTSASQGLTADVAGGETISTTPGMMLESLNLTTGQSLPASELSAATVENQGTTEGASQALVIKKPSERITGFTIQSDSTFAIASVATTTKGNSSRLIFTKGGKDGKNTKGIAIKKTENSTLESLLATQKGQLLSVFSLYQGVLPFEMAVIDSKSGQVSSGADLGLPAIPFNQRFSNLTQSPDGTIYATTMGIEGFVTLVQLDLVNKSIVTGKGKIINLARLSYNKKVLGNDLASLAFSPSNQLFALADPNNEGVNSLFTLDMKTGALTLLRQFAVDKIAFGSI